jgi:hypothetical protein
VKKYSLKSLLCKLKGNQDIKMKKTKEKNYLFTLTGGWTIVGNMKEQLSCDGSVYGFKLPDGRVVQLVVALEVEDKNGDYTYVTSEKEMEKLGFESLDYDRMDFTEPDEPIQAYSKQ